MALDAQRDAGVEALANLYRAKASAELADAEAIAGCAAPGWRGNPGGALVFVISPQGDGAEMFPGAVVEAATKAAGALGLESEQIFFVSSRPCAGADSGAVARRLALAIEADDPRVVIALDDAAGRDLAAAFGIPALRSGEPGRVRGRIVGLAGDLGASLGDEKQKRRVWQAMRAIWSETTR